MARPGSGLLVPVNGLGYPPQNLARVVVWEWMNEHGRWRPYSAVVCHHIENVLKGDARGTVVLGQVDAQLTAYIIDLQSMHQFRQDTGKRCGIYKSMYMDVAKKGFKQSTDNKHNSHQYIFGLFTQQIKYKIGKYIYFISVCSPQVI